MKPPALATGELPCQPPLHLAVREERACARRFLHADPLRRPLEFVLALLRTEEVAALLVFAGRGAVAALHRHSADGVIRPSLGPAVARVHVPSPRLPATNPAICKVNAALAHPMTRIAVREALPRMGILLHTPGAHGPLRSGRYRRPRWARRTLARHLRRPCPVFRARGFRRTERGLRAQEQTGTQQQGAGGLPGEEEASHARDNLQRHCQNAAKARALACLQARPPGGFVLTGAPPGGSSTWPNSSAI
jgi:hypothetical protein